MSDDTPPGPLVVGLLPESPDRVVAAAVRIARLLGTGLVIAEIDEGRAAVREDDPGRRLPLDPDLAGDEGSPDPRATGERLRRLVPPDVRWELRTEGGEAAAAMMRIADAVDAPMIVVGTRPRTAASTLRQFFGGSVAVHLAHRQGRPVLVVPIDPAGDDAELPWRAEDPR